MIKVGTYTPGLGGGTSLDIAEAGSGVSVPPGLECILEYNGLLLNTQNTAERYRVTSIDGLMDADIRDTRDVNTDEHGETPFAAYYGGKTIVINGVIQAYTIPKLRDMQMALRTAFLDISRERPLHFRTGDFSKDVIINCKKLAPLSGIEQQGNLSVMRDFQVTLRASNPRFLAYYPSTFEIALPSSTQLSAAGTIKSYGNFEAQPVIRYYGPMSNANIYNDATGETVSVLSIGAGDYLDFDMAKRTLRNSAGLNMWSRFADGSDYLTIAPGSNFIMYSGDAPKIRITWRDSYL